MNGTRARPSPLTSSAAGCTTGNVFPARRRSPPVAVARRGAAHATRPPASPPVAAHSAVPSVQPRSVRRGPALNAPLGAGLRARARFAGPERAAGAPFGSPRARSGRAWLRGETGKTFQKRLEDLPLGSREPPATGEKIARVFAWHPSSAFCPVEGPAASGHEGELSRQSLFDGALEPERATRPKKLTTDGEHKRVDI
eukprot:scaffold389_cov382-Prasinococcus_capsulatus_cf.AAC.27